MGRLLMPASCTGTLPAVLAALRCSRDAHVSTLSPPLSPAPPQLHGALLQRSLKPARAAQYRASMAAVPLAVREAAFVEAADCFAALLGRAEVGGPKGALGAGRAGGCRPAVCECLRMGYDMCAASACELSLHLVT